MSVDISEETKQQFQKINKRLKPPTVALMGRTGSGKSSLIKTIFDLSDDEISAGAGRPITQVVTEYKPLGKNIILHDSPGYETDKVSTFFNETLKYIEEQSQSADPDQRIHLVWYVFHAALARLEGFDIEILKILASKKIPTIIVLNQADIAKPREKTKLKELLQEYDFLQNTVIAEVAADPNTGEPFGIQSLVDETTKLMPELYVDAFIAAQGVNVRAKRKVAWSFVAAAATVSFGVALIPMPGTTPAGILVSQTKLVDELSKLYGGAKPSMKLTTFSLGSVLALMGTGVLDTVAVSIWWAIPFYTSIEVISGAISASYLIILGLALISTFEEISLLSLKGDQSKKELKALYEDKFKTVFNKHMNKYKDLKVRSREDITEIGNQFINESF